ncbi:exopolysaccharide production protein ExoY [Arthrobacter sp. Hiyo8]|nr:exopolysaccharide production protein ExoY [Arthrobacter sp. Hiyo8]
MLVALLAPLFLILALLVKFTSPGPIFYVQERIGFRGTTFKLLKFRSMRLDADADLRALLMAQGSADTPLFKIENDPRITRVGHILRRYSLDELPQLLNVIGGSMSLVGLGRSVKAKSLFTMRQPIEDYM